MGATGWGRARGAYGYGKGAMARTASLPVPSARLLPAALFLIGLLLLTGAILAAAPAAHAAPLTDTHTWDGGAGPDDQNWSTPLNWADDSLPGNGDDLVFPDGYSIALNDDFLTSVGSVDIGQSVYVWGSAVTVAGLLFGRAAEDWGCTWDVPTTLRDDTTIGTVPTGNPTGAPFAMSQDISLEDGAGDGHTLTVDTVDANQVALSGRLVGSGALVKLGTGTLRMGYGGVPTDSTWDGPTDVLAGSLIVMAPGALSSHTDVQIAEEGTVAAELWDSSDVWSTTFTGGGCLSAVYGPLTLAAASDEFTGTALCGSWASLTQTGSFPALTQVWGTLRGTGSVGALEVYSGGSLSPGVDDFESATLSMTGIGSLSGGSSYTCDVGDVAGPAGAGYDQPVFDGDVTFTEATASPVAVVLRSGAGGTEGPATGFSGSAPYRWPVLRSDGSIEGFSVDAVSLDTSAFVEQNPGADGTFGLEVTDHETFQTLDVVYTPTETAGPVAGFGNALACGSGYLNAPNSEAVSFSGASELTVEMWVRPHGGATDLSTLMRQRDGGADSEETWVGLTTENALFCGIQNYGDRGWLWLGFDHKLPVDAWSHVAFVKTTDELRLYVDGALVNTGIYGAPQDGGAPSAAPLTFGGEAGGSNVPADLDEIMLYDRALSGAQLAAVYNRGPGQGLATGGAEPVRYYRLDETEGTAAADAGSDGVDASLVSMGAAPWIASTAGRESEGRHSAPGVVALAYGSFGAADLTVNIEQQPEHGTVDLTAAALGQGTYTPSAGWAGTETFTYTVSDGTTTTDPLTAWVTAPAPDTHTWDAGAGTDKWSDASNWDSDTVPADGDSLVFPDGPPFDPVNDLTGLTLQDVTLARPGMAVLGNAIVLTGALVRTVADEAEIDWHPDLQLGDEATLRSTAGILNIKAAVSGADLTKTGAGTVSLRDASSYTGKTVVEAGTLHFNADGALPAGSAVSIAAGATADVDVLAKGITVFDNVFSGPEGAGLRFLEGTQELTGDSSAFAGTTEANARVIVTGSLGGTLRGRDSVSGSGTVGAMDGIMVVPGLRDDDRWVVSTLTGSSWSGRFAGFCVTDATEDPGAGFDQLRITGDVDVPGVIGGEGGLTVVPVSVDGTGTVGLCANFDPATGYRWPVVHVDGQVNGFDPAAVSVMVVPSMFANDLAGGTFGLELTDHTTYRSLDVVFTPCADFTDGPEVGDGGSEFVKASKQTVAWEMDAAPPAGSVFKVVADDPGSATAVLLATVPATSETKYSCDWTIAQGPSAGWHVTVQLWSESGDAAVQYRTKDSQTFDIVPAEYTIKPSVVGGAFGHGTISPATDQAAAFGATPKFTFAPDTGYRVKEVLVDDSAVTMTGDDEYVFPAVTKDHAISVEFTIDTFAITVTAGEHGSITPGTGPVEYGSSPKYTVTPHEGYHTVDVVADDTSLGAVPDVTFSSVAEAHTLSATFAIDTYTITPSVVGGAAGHGTISPATPRSVDWHSAPTFTFAPEEGYEVDAVRVDGTPVGMTGPDRYTFPAVAEAHTISVSFKPLTFVITVTAGEHGNVTPGTGSVGWGSTPEYAIAPDEGYRVADVLVDGSSVGAVTGYRFAAVTAAHTFAANFVAEGMPWASVSGASGSWSRQPVTLTFTGHPGEGGVTVAYTEYKLGDGDWTRGGSVTVGAQGATEVWYRAVDEAGTVQDPAGRCLVRVDTRRPRVTAKPLSARPSTIVRLRYKVKDPVPSSGLALVRCVVRDARGRVVTRSSSVPVKVNRWLRLRVTTWAIHEAGKYTMALRAKDLAGNWQRGWTRVRLTIR